MALPITSAPLPPDIASTDWAAITVRIAWTLMTEGVRVSQEVLADARDHVLFHLAVDTPLTQAEDLASHLTSEFIQRARGSRIQNPWPKDIHMPLSPRWHSALEKTMTPLARTIFALHYGDGRSMEYLEQALQVDRTALEGARGGIRGVIRQTACDDGVPLDQWSAERVDRLISRLAAYVPHPSPPLHEVADGCHQDHIQRCPRSRRTWRLASNGVLNSDDLIPPLVGARPEQRVRVLALHFHPEARQYRQAIAKEANADRCLLDDDLLLIDLTDEKRVYEVVMLATEVGMPKRAHLRGIVLEGPGRWSRHGLLGVLPTTATKAIRPLRWGAVKPIGDLPAELPEPPSAKTWWWSALCAAVLAGVVVGGLLHSSENSALPELSAEFTQARGGIWTHFDIPDNHYLGIIQWVNGHPEVVFYENQIAAKAAYAIGDGSFRFHTSGEGILLVSSPEPIENLSHVVSSSIHEESPIVHVATTIQTHNPTSQVRWSTF